MRRPVFPGQLGLAAMLRRLFGRKNQPDSAGQTQPVGGTLREPFLPVSSPANERRAYEIVQEAEAAAMAGNDARAERLFREAVRLDRDASFPGYSLGRYGSFLET